MEACCVICEEKSTAELLTDLVECADEFYNITSFKISEWKDIKLMKICEGCKEKLLQYDTFRTNCVNVCTKLTQISEYVSTSPSFVKVEDFPEKMTKESALERPTHREDALLIDSNTEEPNVVEKCSVGADETDNDPFSDKLTSEENYLKQGLQCQLCGKKFRNLIRYEGHARMHHGPKNAVHKRTKSVNVCTKLTQVSEYVSAFPSFVKAEDNIDDSDRSGNYDIPEKITKESAPERPTHRADALFIDSNNEEPNVNDKCSADSDESDNELLTSEENCLKQGLQCQLCGKKFRNPIRYEGHARMHQGLKPAVCKLCGKEFITYHNLKMHVLHKHTNEPRVMFPCDFEGCDSSFATKQGMMIHRKKHDPEYVTPDPKTFVCELCGKTLSTIGALKKHSFIHTGNMPFHCEVCDKRYPTAHKLKEHTMRHQGIKNHTCPHCGLKKTTMHELRVHMNYHTKEKTFPCDFCDLTFLNTGNLRRHIRIVHRKIKSFNCTHCNQSFGKAETLKHHIMTHTGERPHACTVCGKRFIQLIALRKHTNVHEKIKMPRESCGSSTEPCKAGESNKTRTE